MTRGGRSDRGRVPRALGRGGRTGAAFAVVYLAVLVAKAVLSAVAVRRRRARIEASARPPLPPEAFTIVQPVLGGDPRLADTLAHTLRVAPRSTVVWLVDVDDPAGRAAAEEAAALVPHADVRIVDCPPAPEHASPKTFKLALAEAELRTEAFAIVDDDTRVSEEGLRALAEGLEIAEASTGLPRYAAAPGVWSELVAQFVNDQSAFTYLPAAALAPARTVNGMTWAMRTATLRGLGGFAPLADRIADDLAVATRLKAAGGRIDQTDVVQTVSTTVEGFGPYRRIMHRWMRFAVLVLREEPPAWRAAIAVAGALPGLLLTGAVALLARRDARRLSVLAGFLAVRAAIVSAAHRRLGGASAHRPALSLVAEALMPAQFAWAVVDRRIVWRKRRYLVDANDRYREVR
ncbi:hypothetical protein ET445_07520 [Agromyces protaetiae]|uniref:Glycosyltransferase n=1 Tax=Agromyces protaetiae TaxID=2509455 RepID=A0A4P6FH44_9MICO|nr:glycosyltransferase [Agromyces protaetiae]QAY73217.1 hypothetical protein ET445_07520 [Agromyces protaetiae]